MKASKDSETSPARITSGAATLSVTAETHSAGSDEEQKI